MTKRVYFPEPYQLVIRHNESYIHSVWLGFVSVIFNMPTLLYRSFVLPFILFGWAFLQFVLVMPVQGLLGRLDAEEVDEPRIVLVVPPSLTHDEDDD